MTTKSRPRLATMAWRNIWRNRRRTLITVFGIVFGVFMAVLFTGIGDATYSQMIDHAARLGGGHVVVQHREYQDLPTVEHTVTDAPAVEAAAARLPEVVATTTRITGAAMLATASNSQGTFFIAFDPARETHETFGLLDAEWEGEPLRAADQPRAVVLGKVLADNLGAKLGSKVALWFWLLKNQEPPVFGLPVSSANMLNGAAVEQMIRFASFPANGAGTSFTVTFADALEHGGLPLTK